MKSIYNSTATKTVWFVKRFGYKEMFAKPFFWALAPIIIPFLPKQSFSYKNKLLRNFYHRYSTTWRNERQIEIPIAREIIAPYVSTCWKNYHPRFNKNPINILEVGNVLSHYYDYPHDCVDKFEKAQGVINADIVDWKPKRRYDLILSISTFEHIGYDDDEETYNKPLLAIADCLDILNPGGKMVITLPLGYNPAIDDMLLTGKLIANSETYYRYGINIVWEEVNRKEALHSYKQKEYKTN